MPTPKTKTATFHLLPLNLGRVAEIADQKALTRFALGAVHVVLGPDNYTVEATDRKSLLRVTDPYTGPPDEYPSNAIPSFETAVGELSEALIPNDQWKEIFARTMKLTKKGFKPILKSVAIKVGETAVTLAATNLDQSLCESVRLVEGRFVPTEDIIGQTEKTARPLFSIDANRLKELLAVIVALTPDDGYHRVDFSSAGPGKPVVIRAENETQEIVGIVMPLEG